MKQRGLVASILLFTLVGLAPANSQAQTPRPATSAQATGPWKFAVSGDSRNCGGVVMPAIAAGVKKSGASFYWHLGDFRRLSETDEDIQHQPQYLNNPLTLSEYRGMAWKDFIASQLGPFGSLPVYLVRGNHEMIGRPPGDAGAAYIQQFRPWLDQPNLRAQRLLDDPEDVHPHIYYHWIQNGVDFISLDNGPSQFDLLQVAWFERVLANDSADPTVLTIVAGMHEALPESISKSHSMNETEPGTETGKRVYGDLLDAQNKGRKRVYVLASHSHYFMDGIFNTPYWHDHGGVLPGWIIGTAGAQRYPLPPEKSSAKAATTNVYGFLVATASPSGQIRFDFQHLNEHDVPVDVTARYTPQFVHWCFAENSKALKKNSGD
jgi:Calcineurin-like phosphoesterase